jgi:hypothetical protein
MSIEVTGPDGAIHEFPDDTSPAKRANHYTLALLLLLHPVLAGAQTLVPPEVVRSENVRIDGDMCPSSEFLGQAVA